jgi:MFS family permease
MRNRWFTASQLVLALICVMYFVSYVDRVNMATAAPLITKELGLSNAQMGTLFSVFAISYTLVHIFGGWVGDRYGARRTLFCCGIVWASATVLIGFAQGFYSLVLARLLLGFGEGFNFPAATLAMQRWVRKDARAFAQGLTHSFSRLANAVTPPLVVLLIGLFAGWRGGFILIGLLSLVWVFAWFWYYRDDPREHASVTPHELATLPYNTGAPENRSNIKVPWGQLVPRMLPITLNARRKFMIPPARRAR